MVARAFESYVQASIEGQEGRLSQYLVYGTDDRPHAAYSIYPRGLERPVMHEAFDSFLSVVAKHLTTALTEPAPLRTRETPEISEP
jgi:hypothetical protein